MRVHHLKSNRTGHILRLNGPWISIKVNVASNAAALSQHSGVWAVVHAGHGTLLALEGCANQQVGVLLLSALQFPDSALPVATRVSELCRVDSPTLATGAAGGLAGAGAADMAAEGDDGDGGGDDKCESLDTSSREAAAAPSEAGAMEVGV